MYDSAINQANLSQQYNNALVQAGSSALSGYVAGGGKFGQTPTQVQGFNTYGGVTAPPAAQNISVPQNYETVYSNLAKPIRGFKIKATK
jgi:hypothetical protein